MNKQYATLIAALGIGLAVVTIGLLIVGTHHLNDTASTAPGANNVSPQASPEQNTPSGDVPDNAVFLDYTSKTGCYSIQYIEGWVLTENSSSGVDIRDKDSTESVQIVSPPMDNLSAYVQQVDIPRLKENTAAFVAGSVSTAMLNGRQVTKLTYTSLSDPDPVTGKQRQVTSDRYYLPGTKQLAIVTLTTPVGVDNVDAFNQIVGSFRWV